MRLVKCPVCSSAVEKTSTLERSYLLSTLGNFLETSVPGKLINTDYQMQKCLNCQLEFASPMQAASDEFYDWLNRNNDYYTDDRWEWGEVERIITDAAEDSDVSVLEVGAGAGFLLKRLAKSPSIDCVAIERSDNVVSALESAGISAYTPASAELELAQRNFDYVMAFHCLEHVEDPIGFVAAMKGWLKPGGHLFLSVPHSPMFFERSWFDPLNYPPHHLSRWNTSALAELARQLGGEISFHAPQALSLKQRVWQGFMQGKLKRRWRRRSRMTKLLTLVKHPMAVLAELVWQLRRPRVNGEPAADVILAKISFAG